MIARPTLTEEVLEILAERILTSELPAGSRLQVNDLAADLGTSSTPVREALHTLASERLVDALPRRGFVVRPISAGEARQLYEVIAALESLVLSGAAPFPAALVAQLEVTNEELEGAQDAAAALALDARWHDLLLSNSANEVALGLLRNVKRRAQRYEYRYLADRGRLRTASSQHRQILVALRANDMAAAAKAVAENWLHGAERIGRWLDAAEEG